jgi:hypothetical protein
MTRTALLAACAIIGACTTIKVNDDDTTTIEHKGGVEAARDLAARACRRIGEHGAELISTVNKDPALPPGAGVQLSTFRCSAAEQP